MASRPYSSSTRSAAAAERRGLVVQAAIQLLREQQVAHFSLEAVAKAAGVARLTVYKQFGSRRGLLEAVFNEISCQGGLTRLPKVITIEDPTAALRALVNIFCDFWSSDAAIGRLFDAISLDPEFGEAVLARNELRRGVLEGIVDRMSLRWPSATARRETVDLLFALTSYPFYRQLAPTRANTAIKRIVTAACLAALERTRSTRLA